MLLDAPGVAASSSPLRWLPLWSAEELSSLSALLPWLPFGKSGLREATAAGVTEGVPSARRVACVGLGAREC